MRGGGEIKVVWPRGLDVVEYTSSPTKLSAVLHGV
jgi:hypothetical protein